MYKLVSREDVIRIPPDMLGEDIDILSKKLAQKTFEGLIGHDKTFTLLVTDVKRSGQGRIVHGDGAVYQKITYKALTFRPDVQEVIIGNVCEVLKFGAFVRFGPLDGLLHISQVMDDRIEVDVGNQRLNGKDTKRDLRVGDTVIARVVASSINELNPRESKIGLTMRQPALGKLEWIIEDRQNEARGS